MNMQLGTLVHRTRNYKFPSANQNHNSAAVRFCAELYSSNMQGFVRLCYDNGTLFVKFLALNKVFSKAWYFGSVL